MSWKLNVRNMRMTTGHLGNNTYNFGAIFQKWMFKKGGCITCANCNAQLKCGLKTNEKAEAAIIGSFRFS